MELVTSDALLFEENGDINSNALNVQQEDDLDDMDLDESDKEIIDWLDNYNLQSPIVDTDYWLNYFSEDIDIFTNVIDDDIVGLNEEMEEKEEDIANNEEYSILIENFQLNDNITVVTSE
jgi:hypothetical protein